jgi:hypothetical protein
MNRSLVALFFLPTVVALLTLASCNKQDRVPGNPHNAGGYSAEVLDKWMTLQIRLMRNTTGVQNQAFSRPYAYAAIAALEAIGPGLPAHKNWSGRWNGLTGLPAADHSVRYYYPANVNAALAAMNKAMFPNASAADKAAIDSLEDALKQAFLASESASRVEVSAVFGKAVANAVYNWAETDGYKNASAAYTPPMGDGLWIPTPPAFGPPASPYWGNNRPVMKGSIANTQPPAPPAYSIEPSSVFYQMVKQVYDVSQALTDDQKAMAIFWRDVPGVTTPGHWVSIVQQVIRQTHSKLDKAVIAYALTGTAINDALISCWQTKYHHNLVRPVSYIRGVLGYTTWTSFIGTPAHPEYTSAHAVLSVAAAEVLQQLYGDVGSFTDHTYDYLGMGARTFSSLSALGREAAQSRLYAGIHYQPSIDAGIEQGKQVTANILSHPGKNP